MAQEYGVAAPQKQKQYDYKRAYYPHVFSGQPVGPMRPSSRCSAFSAEGP